MRKESVAPFVSGVVVGAIVLLIVIFAASWVVTSSSANDKATQMVEEAIVDRLASIAVVQFHQDPNKEDKLNEMREMRYYQRNEYVEEAGWATMPGDELPDPEVAEECAERLMDLPILEE